jgi:hypothetical protein
MTSHHKETIMVIIWSNGLGTQSTAIAILIRQGRLPRPDRIVTADTGREFKRAWEYSQKYVAPMLAEIGLKIEIAPHSLSTVDLYSHKGEILIPAYDATKVNSKGEHAKLPTFCSNEWKTRVVRRYIGGAKGNQDGVIMWLGMSLDEKGRLKPSGENWCKNYWPLCFDVKMTRAECKDLIERYGFPPSIKSRCKMCPHQGDDEWLEVKEEPDEWAESIALDEQIFQSHGARLHRSCQPLSQVTFVPRNKETVEPLFDCQSGFCWT